jgi:hypothetical protein
MDYLPTADAIVKEIGGNRIYMETLCMATVTTMEEAQEQLVDYSLHCSQKDILPISRRAAMDGFHLWLRRNKRFKSDRKGNGRQQGGLVI